MEHSLYDNLNIHIYILCKHCGCEVAKCFNCDNGARCKPCHLQIDKCIVCDTILCPECYCRDNRCKEHPLLIKSARGN